MFNFPIEKYHFYFTKNKVIAVSTYAGQSVRGVAICDEGDQFDKEKGKMLAAARCNQKVAQKRKKRADEKLKNAVIAYEKAAKHMYKMNEYYEDARVAVKNANMRVKGILKEM